MDIFYQLLDDVTIPKFAKIRQIFPRPIIEDIEKEINQQINEKGLFSTIQPGQKIAITGGSRGVANIAVMTKEIVRMIKAVGGEPFIVPAMGSHGSSNAEGQAKVLHGMGITEEFCGAPIRATMEVVQIGVTDSGLPVFVDKFANEADGIVIINRIKPHVGFTGKYESGLMKMLAIGLGKQKGAEVCHN